jgi:glycine cleavage system H lipoate-binding protein
MIVERYTNHKAPTYVLQPAPAANAGTSKLVPIVAGFELPEHLRLHQGHTWAMGEGPSMVRVGIDDFAAKLIGEPEAVMLPQRGQWIRQGQKVCSFRVNGELVEMLSPIEGTVSDINDEMVRHPEKLAADPYGQSWLMTVDSPDARTNFRNLLSGVMARDLIAESAKKLAGYMPAAAGNLALAQDGGKAHEEIANLIPAEKHAAIAKEFFLAA